jgi:hypothetical protein
MTRQRCPAAAREQPETIIQAICDSPRAEGVDAARRKLDGERIAVELATNVGNDRRVGIIELEFIEAASRALDEKLDRQEGERLRSGEPG